jgi:hypothetical protein
MREFNKRPQLMKHIRRFTSGENAKMLFVASEKAINDYYQNSLKGTYKLRSMQGARPERSVKLVKKLEVGARINREKNQRRKNIILLPKTTRGRPKNNEIRVLVSQLAYSFARVINKPITLNWGGKPSAFQEYVEGIFILLRIPNSRDWIQGHFKNRSKTSSVIFSS